MSKQYQQSDLILYEHSKDAIDTLMLEIQLQINTSITVELRRNQIAGMELMKDTTVTTMEWDINPLH